MSTFVECVLNVSIPFIENWVAPTTTTRYYEECNNFLLNQAKNQHWWFRALLRIVMCHLQQQAERPQGMVSKQWNVTVLSYWADFWVE